VLSHVQQRVEALRRVFPFVCLVRDVVTVMAGTSVPCTISISLYEVCSSCIVTLCVCGAHDTKSCINTAMRCECSAAAS
jgi:hypothetical protein